MNAILTLAGLTIKEAVRRRVLLGALLIAGVFLLLAFLHFPRRSATVIAPDMIGRILAWNGCGIMKFFGSIIAITLAAGAITAEVERGVLSVVVPKPLSRASVYLGKWLGLVALLAACMVLWGALLVFAVWNQSHTFHPRILTGILATCLFPLLFVTLTLAFSSFATYSLSAGLALIAAGVALAENLLARFGKFLDVPSLTTASQVVSYIVPLSRMNHWITRGLGDAGLDMSAFLDPARGGGAAAVATTMGDMIYILIYIAAALALGLFVFQKRDL